MKNTNLKQLWRQLVVLDVEAAYFSVLQIFMKINIFEIAGNKSAGKVDIVQLCTTRPPSTGFVISTFRLLSELHAQQGLHGD